MSHPTRKSRAVPARRLGFLLVLAWSAAIRADPVISEFLAASTKTNADNDGAYSDWIEIFNPDPAPASLAGWSLTDSPTDKKKWSFPAVTVPAAGLPPGLGVQ